MFIPQSCDEELIPEGRPVGSVVQEADCGVGAVFDCATDDVHGGGVRAGTLEEAAVATEDLLGRVAG